MRKVVLFVGVFGIFGLALVGCDQWAARKFGGTVTITLAACQKLLMATWKEDSLWHLTRPMRAGEVAETYTFKEDSVFGNLEGTAIIKEVPCS